MVINSGATSSFVRPKENLPITGPSSKIDYLPDGSSIQATHTTMLQYESLSKSKNSGRITRPTTELFGQCW